MANDKDFKVKNGIQPTVYHEGVGTVVSGSVGYSIASASYDNKSFSIGSEETVPYKIRFNNDGTKLFMLGVVSDKVHQYTLSTAFDISTASYDSVNFSVASQETDPYGLAFNNDGTKMYITGNTSDSIFQYSLSTGFDLSTASYDSVSLSVTSQDTIPTGITFNSTGSKLYMLGQTSDEVHQYSLSTVFDLSTASYDSVSFSIASQETSPMDMSFNSDGTKMYIIGSSSDAVFQYSLSTGFDISTASYDSISFNVNAQDSGPRAVVFNNDGTKMYIVGTSQDTVFQYSTVLTTNTLDLSTGSVFEITPTSDIQVGLSNPAASGTVSQATLLLDQAGYGGYDLSNASYDSVSFSVTIQDVAPRGLFFKSDGLTFFMVGNGTDRVNEYTLTKAWDITTASFTANIFSVANQESFPRGLFFKTDGTKMYIVGGGSGDAIYQYTLSTAWDITTASYDSINLSVASQDTVATDIRFKPDGTVMYISGTSSDSIHQYTLSTAWDLSTASYASKALSIASQDTQPESFYFNESGSKVFVLGIINDNVYQYALSTAWDVSTGSYDSVSFGVSSQEGAGDSLWFGNNGSKMFVLGSGTDTVYQYSTATPATITYPSTLEFSGGTAPTSPAVGETDVITFSTTDGGTSYQAVQAIDGAK
jgi:6-phosphogluconolactonase (cycloisomerase 2 family)